MDTNKRVRNVQYTVTLKKVINMSNINRANWIFDVINVQFRFFLNKKRTKTKNFILISRRPRCYVNINNSKNVFNCANDDCKSLVVYSKQRLFNRIYNEFLKTSLKCSFVLKKDIIRVNLSKNNARFVLDKTERFLKDFYRTYTYFASWYSFLSKPDQLSDILLFDPNPLS